MNKILKSILISVFIGIVIFIIGAGYFNGFKFNSTKSLIISFAFYQLYAFVLGFTNMYFFEYLRTRNWKSEFSITRFFVGFSGSIVITLSGLFFLRAFTAVFYEDRSFNAFINQEKIGNYTFGVVATLGIVLVFHGIYFYNKYQQKKVKEQKVIAGTANAKFDALKNQLDPHFLFNSLNVLTSLIEENPENAKAFTTSLSKIYRYVLEQKNKDLVSVDEELEFAKVYMTLLQMRFEDSIVFKQPKQALNPESKVVPLSLQLVLENAVKHNIVSSNKPLKITIYEEEEYLVVENNLQIKKIVNSSSGVGLNNIKQRYKLLTNRALKIESTRSIFKVKIPMLTKNTTVVPNYNEKQLNESYIRAREYVAELKEFYYNLISYAIIIPCLIFINYKTYWQVKWFIFPMLGWGIGLAFHAYKVYVNDGVLGSSWEQRKIKKFMDQEKNNKWD